MTDTLDQIPPEAWPIIELLFNLTMAAAAVWLAATVFVMWRRYASNLTPVMAAEKNRKADPDFLKVDKKAREQAIRRGESFEKELQRREIEANTSGKRSAGSMIQHLSGLMALVVSASTLLSMLLGAYLSVFRMGEMWEGLSGADRLMELWDKYPVPIIISLIVLVAQIYVFFQKSLSKEA